MKKLVTLLFVVLLCGCAPNINILLDGKPIPHSSYISHSPSTQMRLEAVAYKLKKPKKEDDEVFPDYLTVGKKYELPSNINYVGGIVKIINPLKKKYSLTVIYTVKYSNEKFPYRISHIVYNGVGVDETFNVGRKVEAKKPFVSVQILVGIKNDPDVFNFNFIKYKEVVPYDEVTK